MAPKPPKRTRGRSNLHLVRTTHLDRAYGAEGPVVERGIVARRHGPGTVTVHMDGFPNTCLIMRRKGANWVPVE